MSARPAPAPHGVVTNSVELQRIMALPRRVLDLSKVEDLTPIWRRPGGTMSLWPIQSAMLAEAETAGGLFAPAGVGAGKGLVTLLLPDVFRVRKAALFIPAQLKASFLRLRIPEYDRHFKLPLHKLVVISYSELSTIGKASILDDLRPDLIIADECHMLRHRMASRTKRFMRYMKNHPETRFCALSGTVTSKSLRDYAHLTRLALHERSPLPDVHNELNDWADALDVAPRVRVFPGALRRLLPEAVTPIQPTGDEMTDARAGFRARLVETPGVVATSESALGTSLVIRALDIGMPPAVEAELDKVERTWSVGEDEFQDVLTLYRALRQVSVGFYLRWDWPNGERDEEWLAARSAWHRVVRNYLAYHARDGMDSPLLLARAAAAGRWQCPEWHEWQAVADRPEPRSYPVWISTWAVDAAVKWARHPHAPGAPPLSDPPGSVIWVENVAMGQAIAQRGGFRFYNEGDASFATDPIIVCSVWSQSEGKNLQDRYSRNLITSPSSSAKVWEQLIGRTHRPGQQADEVTADYFAHSKVFRASFEAALLNAQYIKQTQGQDQKLLIADKVEAEPRER